MKPNPDCRVNVCSAKDCGGLRMSFCALRKAYHERVDYIRKLMDNAVDNGLKEKYSKILQGMEADE